MFGIKRSSIVCVIILSGLLGYGKALASSQEYQHLYYRLKNLYDMGKYSECVAECSRIITIHQECPIEAKNHILLASFYELNADCLNRMGSIDKAVTLLGSMLAELDQELPKDHVARIKLKIGHIYRQAGLYSKALSKFQEVEQEYAQIFPNRFARYARENYDEITSKRVAIISGELSLEEKATYEDVTIKVFNGFEESETKPSKQGEYTVPLFSSTPNTRFSLYAYRRGYKPSIVNMVFDGSPKIVIEKIQLEKLPDKDVGVVAGVIFTPVSGGKLKGHHGIARFNRYEIQLQKLLENKNGKEAMIADVASVPSDNNGIYTALLTPGLYLMKNEGKEKIFRLGKGETIILNITRGRILVD